MDVSEIEQPAIDPSKLEAILARLAEIEETLKEILVELRRSQGRMDRLGHN